jgi:acyl-CoA synthetase (AMP-forming)/AMP-acid ligase II
VLDVSETTWTGLVEGVCDHPRPLVHIGDVGWSGQQFLDRAAAAADWLDTLHLPPHLPVPALVATSAEALALVTGGAGAAHPIAPIGVRMTTREAAAVVRALAAPVLVATPEFATSGHAVAELAGCRLAVLPELDASSRTLSAAPDDVAVVLHTSGTTGTPKAVPMPQWRLAARARAAGTLCELDAEGLYGASAAFHHIAGLGNLVVALARGARVTGIPRFTVEGWCRLGELGVTHTSVVPAMLEMVLAAGEARQPRLRVLQYGGAPIRPETLRRTFAALPAVRMFNTFGQTEGSPITVLTPDDHRAAVFGQSRLLQSVGRPVPGVELRIEAPGPAGVGEIWARADHLFRVDGRGWLHTGDLGRVADDGYLYLAGRRGEMIIRGGENVYPLEVETVLGEHPGVADVAVAGVPDERLGQTVAAYVVPVDPRRPPGPEELRAFARTHLSGFKVPVEWHFLRKLPRNPNGKLQRSRLGSSDEALAISEVEQ